MLSNNLKFDEGVDQQGVPSAEPDRRFSRFVDACIPEELLKDPSQVFQARTLIVFVIILTAFSAIGMSVTIAVEETLPFRRVVTMIMVACMSIAVIIMRRTKRLREAGLFFVSLATFIVAYVDFMNRSTDGPATILWVIPYAVTAMLLGSRKALYIGFVSVTMLFLNVVLLNFDLLPSSLSDPANWRWLKVIMFMVVLSIVAVCIYGLTSLERRRQRELSEEIQINKEVMDSLAKATNEARVAARSKELFLATMSHELRTPLNGVLGNAQLLAKELDDTKAKDRVESITASGELLLSIINDVLDYSKFESQGVSINPEVFDISQCLHQLYRLIKPRVASNVEFIVSGADSPLFISADAKRLSQVVLNLLSNAAKFTELGQISLSLGIVENKILRLEVSDSGSGISEENQERLFQDFVQVGDEAHKHMEGTGLGLAITQRIVERMNGSIHVESALGKGTKMIVSLPVDIVDEPSLTVAGDSVADNLVAVNLSELRILIVDDVDMNCMMLEGMLESLGVKDCQIENDGSLAVDRIAKGDTFDLILMDVRMPKMDGLEATRQIRKLGFSKPVIAVTANAFEEDKDDCLNSGMDSFLSKPVDLDDLHRVLAEALN